jgi:hypothetical protein
VSASCPFKISRNTTLFRKCKRTPFLLHLVEGRFTKVKLNFEFRFKRSYTVQSSTRSVRFTILVVLYGLGTCLFVLYSTADHFDRATGVTVQLRTLRRNTNCGK